MTVKSIWSFISVKDFVPNALSYIMNSSIFITHIVITQIGKENNLSAEICKLPYEKLGKHHGFFDYISEPNKILVTVK